jgi:N-acetylglucosaminyl-diphospho-decaprenol L-rhamnosyltransferase
MPAVAASIDVVVPVRGHWELTRSCLEHLAAQSARHRVIVVDDGSDDDTPTRLREEWPAVTVVEMGTSVGYTRAVNRGVAAGDGEHVVLLNNDVELRPDCLERLVAPLREDARVGAVAAVMLRPGGHTIDSVGIVADRVLAGFARLQGRPAREAASAEPPLAGPEGTAGAYRRSAWEQVGGLDERMRAYMEVLDLALRLRAAGWRAAVAPEAVGVHLGSITYGRRSAEQRRLAGFSRAYLLRRYGVLRTRGWARAALTEAIVTCADALLCGDAQALSGRLQGWRAARGLQRRGWPPADALDTSISLRRSLALRRSAIAGD